MRRDKINIFIFRRDLRIFDNTGISKLLKTSSTKKTLFIFIFNPKQIDPNQNEYYSVTCVQYMIDGLLNLKKTLNDKLYFFHADSDEDILNRLLNIYDIDTIGYNKDYTPFAIKRDNNLNTWCKTHGINIITSEDYNLFPMGSIKNANKEPYKVMTSFVNKCKSIINNIQRPINVNLTNDIIIIISSKLKNLTVKSIYKYIQTKKTNLTHKEFSRRIAVQILQNINSGLYNNYGNTRNFPSIDNGTTKLSPFMKFNIVSIREVFWISKDKLGINHPLIFELLVREFYAHTAFNFPYVLSGQVGKRNQPCKLQYDNLKYGYNDKMWQAFTEGKTGFPWIDAGIRQLIYTGWMHNRLRMAVGMFATKDLLFDWRLVENWFARNLCDYDPCSNSGGVQWCSSVGFDSVPYFRIFSPWIQLKKFDPNCEYVKKYIHELKDIPTEHIHNWDIFHKNYKINYTGPIVDHHKQTRKALNLFRK